MAEAVKKAAAKKTAAKKTEGDSLLRQAYGAATSRLREEYRDRFNALMGEETQQRGLTWAPKKTQEQKDREAFEALLAEHPEWGPAPTTTVDPALENEREQG